MVSRRNPGEGDNPHPRSLMISNIQTKRPIIGISYEAKPPIVRVVGVLAWEFSTLLAQCLNGLPVAFSLGTGNGILYLFVGWIWFSPFFPIVLRHQDCLNKRI